MPKVNRITEDLELETINITPIVNNIHKIVENHKLAPGSYKRYPIDTAPNAYGCADAANILYSIGKFPKDRTEREASVKILQEMQNPETGIFIEDIDPSLHPGMHIHHPVHTTAHCMAALELFDASPLYCAKELEKYLSYEEMCEFMEQVDFINDPWSGSHRPAGLYVALNLGGSDTVEFNKNYFNWMWDNADPDTGMWRKNCQNGVKPIWAHMAGSFHYLFNHEHAHMPLRYPEKMIDTCISMYKDEPRKNFGMTAGFIEIDWVFCLTRAIQQTPHRFYEVIECLEDFAEKYCKHWLENFDSINGVTDMHALFGSVCCFAELQRALRGKLYSEVPMKLVLDRRPFI